MHMRVRVQFGLYRCETVLATGTLWIDWKWIAWKETTNLTKQLITSVFRKMCCHFFHMTLYFAFCILVTVRCWCARKNKPHFQRREECTCGNLQRFKTLLWKYFSRTDCSRKWPVVVFAKSMQDIAEELNQ